MKRSLALFSTVALVACGSFSSTASADYIYRGQPQLAGVTARYWVNDHYIRHHGHRVLIPGHWVWIK